MLSQSRSHHIDISPPPPYLVQFRSAGGSFLCLAQAASDSLHTATSSSSQPQACSSHNLPPTPSESSKITPTSAPPPTPAPRITTSLAERTLSLPAVKTIPQPPTPFN